MKTADFYQGTADAMGVALYLYSDGSVTNSRKAGVEPTAMIKPHDRWKPADDHAPQSERHEPRRRAMTRSRRAEATALPGWIQPQLTKLVDAPPRPTPPTTPERRHASGSIAQR